ncbi:MAG: tetratricopeptide repeat protein [Deltaproteobacteria bacterium]|nr:tetratricopeptide repeat protein [Deltaproteobacteria bacterium]
MRSVLVAAVILTACSRGVPAPDPVVVPTRAQADAFATKFAAAMSACAPELTNMFDIDQLARRALDGRGLPADAARGVVAGMKDSGSLLGVLCKQFPPGTHYTLLRVREVGGAPRPLYRVTLGGDGGTNYHEVELSVSPEDHQVRGIDMYIYSSGEKLSVSLGDMISQAMAASDRGNDIGATGVAMGRMREKFTRGDWAGARAELAGMPAELRKTKAMRLVAVQIAMNLDEAGYAAEIAGYQRDFPDDPSLDLVSIDGYFMKKDFAALRTALARLDQRVGGDPYLDVLRANADFLDGKPDAAIADARSATSREPTMPEGWINLARFEAALGHTTEAIAALDHLPGLGQALDDQFFIDSPGLAPIRETDEFKAHHKP